MNQAGFSPALVYFLFSFCALFLFGKLSFGLSIFCPLLEQTWRKLCASLFALTFRGLILQGEFFGLR